MNDSTQLLSSLTIDHHPDYFVNEDHYAGYHFLVQQKQVAGNYVEAKRDFLVVRHFTPIDEIVSQLSLKVGQRFCVFYAPYSEPPGRSEVLYQEMVSKTLENIRQGMAIVEQYGFDFSGESTFCCRRTGFCGGVVEDEDKIQNGEENCLWPDIVIRSANGDWRMPHNQTTLKGVNEFLNRDSTHAFFRECIKSTKSFLEQEQQRKAPTRVLCRSYFVRINHSKLIACHWSEFGPELVMYHIEKFPNISALTEEQIINCCKEVSKKYGDADYWSDSVMFNYRKHQLVFGDEEAIYYGVPVCSLSGSEFRNFTKGLRAYYDRDSLYAGAQDPFLQAILEQDKQYGLTESLLKKWSNDGPWGIDDSDWKRVKIVAETIRIGFFDPVTLCSREQHFRSHVQLMRSWLENSSWGNFYDYPA